MSVKSWIEEFYTPITWRSKKMTRVEALEHSLKKWIGLRAENLKKHEVDILGQCVCSKDAHERESEKSLAVSCDTCALCWISALDCHDCPIDQTEEEEERGERQGCRQQYTTWAWSGYPEPMITIIQEALEREKNDH